MAPQPTSGPASQVPVLLTAVFLAYLAQMTLNPIIAPLSREVGLAEWQIGVVISVAAVMVVVTSQRWGRASQSWGRKPVLVAALALAAASMGLFALSAWFGMTGVVSGAVLFVVFVMLRGVAFGTALAAVPPTAQAYIADVTTDEAARVKGIAGVGAVQGIAMVVGSVVGGVLADSASSSCACAVSRRLCSSNDRRASGPGIRGSGRSSSRDSACSPRSGSSRSSPDSSCRTGWASRASRRGS
jgi:MFS family permease